MFKFLYKFSFFRYYDSLTAFKKHNGREFAAPLIVMAFYMYVASFGYGESCNSWAYWFEPLILIGLCNIYLAFSRNAMPSVANLQPISIKKRTLYDFIAPIVLAIVVVCAITLAACVLLFIYCLLLLILVNENVFSIFPEIFANIFMYEDFEYPELGIYASLTMFGYYVIAYCSAMRLNSFVTTKSKIIYTAAVNGGILLLMYITIAPASSQDIVPYMFSDMCYTATSVPWLFSTLWLLGAAGIMADMIIALVRTNKKKRLM